MQTFTIRKDGLVARILTYHVDHKRHDFGKKITSLLERQKGVCGLFWSLVWRTPFFILYSLYKCFLDAVYSIAFLLVKLVGAVFAVYWFGHKPDFTCNWVDAYNVSQPLFVQLESKVGQEGFAECGPMMKPTMIFLIIMLMCIVGQATLGIHEQLTLMPKSVSTFADTNSFTHLLVGGLHFTLFLSLVIGVIVALAQAERFAENEVVRVVSTWISSSKMKICPRVEFT